MGNEETDVEAVCGVKMAEEEKLTPEKEVIHLWDKNPFAAMMVSSKVGEQEYGDLIELTVLGRRRCIDYLKMKGGPVEFDELIHEVHGFVGQYGDYKFRDAAPDIYGLIDEGFVGAYKQEGHYLCVITPKGYLDFEK